MKLGIGALAAGNPTGLGRLCRNAVIGLAAGAEGHEVHVFLRTASDQERIREEATPPLRPALDNLHYHIGSFPRIPFLQRYWLEQQWIPQQARMLGLDAYLGCDFCLPMDLKIHRRMVLLPDMLPFTRPETVSLAAGFLYRRAIVHAVRSGAGLLCISEVTRTNLLERFPGAADQAEVLYPPLSPILWTYASRQGSVDLELQVQGSLHMFKSQRPYILAVGVRGPRKNTELLVRIYRELVLSGDYHGSLVLAGGDGEFHTANSSPRLAVVALGQQPGAQADDSPAIHDIGRVNDFDLSQLYRAADLLVSLSLEEGFGYPVLEALAHGTPALVSRGSAMREISEGGIAETGLNPPECRVKLLSTLNSLPLLRREAAGIRLEDFSVEEYGRRIIELFEAMETE
ncbi:glycosyltransferase family 4 protein [bacterium]|nr:glycosyltransferase family 4 protein [bacterium]